MVERVKSKTKLAFETKRLDEIKISAKDDFVTKNISVSQEWSKLWRAASFHRKHHRVPPEKGSRQHRHFITDMIEDTEVTVRNAKQKAKYSVREEFKNLSQLTKHSSYDWRFQK